MHIFIFADTGFLSIPETNLLIANQYFSSFKKRKARADDHLQLIALVWETNSTTFVTYLFVVK